MVKPAAIAKAEAFDRFLSSAGGRQPEDAVAITVGEGYELLDWLAAQHPGNPVLAGDIAAAKEAADPWLVLEKFRLQGFEILRADALH